MKTLDYIVSDNQGNILSGGTYDKSGKIREVISLNLMVTDISSLNISDVSTIYLKNNEVRYKPEIPEIGMVFDIAEENWVWDLTVAEIDAKREEDFSKLRLERNRLLLESDFSQLPDVNIDQTAWAVYRQALRDLPDNTVDPRNPDWPIRP